MKADASACSVMPGVVRVTVSDAAGNSVTRTAHVGSRRTVLPSPCGEVPLVDPSQPQPTASGRNYYGSAKTGKVSAPRGIVYGMKPVSRSGVKYIPPGPPQQGDRTRSFILSDRSGR
jgi:hypothetical protein